MFVFFTSWNCFTSFWLKKNTAAKYPFASGNTDHGPRLDPKMFMDQGYNSDADDRLSADDHPLVTEIQPERLGGVGQGCDFLVLPRATKS